MTTYAVYALAHVQVYIGSVEAENQKEATTKGLALFRTKEGKIVRDSDMVDTPTIEEFYEVEVEK